VELEAYLMRVALILSGLLVLGGCAAGYRPDGPFNGGVGGGYEESWRAPDRVQVHFRGNAFNTPMQVQEMALLRAAELGRNHGYTHFVLLDERNATTYGVMPQQSTTTGAIGSTGNFRAVTTTDGGGSIARPGATILVQFVNSPGSAANVYSIEFIESTIGSKYRH
jgi:hypothetical protein